MAVRDVPGTSGQWNLDSGDPCRNDGADKISARDVIRMLQLGNSPCR